MQRCKEEVLIWGEICSTELELMRPRPQDYEEQNPRGQLLSTAMTTSHRCRKRVGGAGKGDRQ